MRSKHEDIEHGTVLDRQIRMTAQLLLLLSLALQLLSAPPASAPRFEQDGVPFSFDIPKSLTPSVGRANEILVVELRDWAKDDNFRAFQLSIRTEPADKNVPLEALSTRIVAGLRGAGAYEDVKVHRKARATWKGLDTMDLHMTYVNVGGREYYQDHRGRERHTSGTQLKMESLVRIFYRKGVQYTLTLDSSIGQSAERHAQWNTVLQSFRFGSRDKQGETGSETP